MAAAPNAQGLALFPEAVRAVFERWTALNLAVSHNWGDGDSHAKREELISHCVGGFASGKKVDPTEVEDFLDGFLLQNFTTEADDDSTREVISLDPPVAHAQPAAQSFPARTVGSNVTRCAKLLADLRTHCGRRFLTSFAGCTIC